MQKFIMIFFEVIVFQSLILCQEVPYKKFDSRRIDVGTLYVYEYSRNSKDFLPVDKRYIYIKSLNDIESLIVPIKDSTNTWLDNISMNWNYMMLAKRIWRNLENKNTMGIGSSLEGYENIDFANKTLNGVNTQKLKDGFKKIYFTNRFESIPTYFYSSTSLMDLWFALRFYPINKNMITVNNVSNDYNTSFEIKYEGQDKVNVPYGNVTCYKFELVPQLSFFMRLLHSPKKAFIWLSSEGNSRYMVKYINNNEQNTFIRSMEYRLLKKEKMSPSEWEKFKAEHGVKKDKKLG